MQSQWRLDRAGGEGFVHCKVNAADRSSIWREAFSPDLREDLAKKMFSFGHFPNYLPYFGQLVPLFRTSKTAFCVYDRKNTNHDNDGCNDNYDVNFDDNDDKNDQINIQILRGFGKNLPILGVITW